MEKYRHPENDNVTDLDWQYQHIGQYGDVEFHTTPQIETAEIYETNTGTRDILGVIQPGEFFVGQHLCMYGRSTGFHCADVRMTSETCGETVASRLVVMRTNKDDLGDSGAPWFSGVTAAGIHKGWCRIDGERRDVFSKANLLPEALDVHVRRQ